MRETIDGRPSFSEGELSLYRKMSQFKRVGILSPEGSRSNLALLMADVMTSFEKKGENIPHVLIHEGPPNSGKTHLRDQYIVPFIEAFQERKRLKDPNFAINLKFHHWDATEAKLEGIIKDANTSSRYRQEFKDLIFQVYGVADEKDFAEKAKRQPGQPDLPEFLHIVSKMLSDRVKEDIDEHRQNTLIVVEKPGATELPSAEDSGEWVWTSREYGAQAMAKMLSELRDSSNPVFVGYSGVISGPRLLPRTLFRNYMTQARPQSGLGATAVQTNLAQKNILHIAKQIKLPDSIKDLALISDKLISNRGLGLEGRLWGAVEVKGIVENSRESNQFINERIRQAEVNDAREMMQLVEAIRDNPQDSRRYEALENYYLDMFYLAIAPLIAACVLEADAQAYGADVYSIVDNNPPFGN